MKTKVVLGCLLAAIVAFAGCEELQAQDQIDSTISILEQAPDEVTASRNTDDDKLLQIVATVAVSQQLGEGAQAAEVKAQAQALVQRMDRMPLRKWYVLRQVKQELRTEGLWTVGAQGVNWEAIGDFLVKIAPIIFKLIELFIGIG